MSNQRRIIFVSSNFPPVVGGSAVVYDQLCRNSNGRLIAIGASRDYRNGKKWDGLAEADANRDYLVYRLPYLRPPAFENDSANWGGKLARAFLRDLPVMARLLASIWTLSIKHRAKVICLGELIYGGWLVFPLRYLLGRRVIIYTHGEEISQDAETFLARRRGLFLRHAHRIISVSLFCKGQIISKYHIDPNKICVINNGVDLTAFRRDDPQPNIWPQEIRGRKIILSVSRLVERKGQETLIRAMPEILAIHPDAHCVVVGGGPLEEKLKSLVQELGISDHCTVIGPAPQSDVLSYFRNCSIFALPCHTLPDGDTEGFGLVFLEAGACGKPVIAGVAGGTVEAVADGETGLLVDGTNIDQVGFAVITLLSNPTYAEALGEKGWQRAQKSGWGSVARHFVEACDIRGSLKPPPSYYPIEPANIHGVNKATDSSTPNLLVTVDVEEEFGWKNLTALKHSVKGADALRRFHDDCRSVNVSPVYLLTYPMLMNTEYRDFLKGVVTNGEAEVGIHLHSWTAPPYWEDANAFTSYQCNLPEHIERRKLETLCLTFKECFGRPVFIHRAGRWGGSGRTSDILEKFGIRIDLSPSTGYSDLASGGPNFTNLDGSPFWSGSERQVLTIPASSVNYLRGPALLSAANFALSRKFPSLRSRGWHWGKPVRFSPENADESTLFAIARELKHRSAPAAVYTLHSTSLYINGNPYSTGNDAANTLRKRSLDFLSRAIGEGIVFPTTCSALLDSARAARIAVP